MVTMPHSPEAEQAVLACCMIEDGAAEMAVKICSVKWFYDRRNREIFAHIAAMVKAGQIVDLTTVHATMKDGTLGVADYLIALTHILPNASNLEKYIKMLKDNAILRQTVKVSQNIINEAAGGTVLDVDDFMLNLRGRFPSGSDDSIYSMSDIADEVSRRMRGYYSGDRKVYPCGLAPIDAHFGGGLPRGLYVIGARTNIGKTEFALDMAIGMAEKGTKVRFDQLELGPEESYEKIVAKKAGGYRGQLVHGKIEKERAYDAWCAVGGLPLVCASQAYNVDQLRISCEMNRARFDVLFIDQFDKILFRRGSGAKYALEEYDYIMQSLLRISRELDMSVVLLAQLNREVNKRADKRPFLSDFKNSGAIEQTADVVWLLDRPNKDGNDDYLKVYQDKDRLMERTREYKFVRENGRLKGV